MDGPQCDELSSTRGFSAGLTSLVVERRAASRKGVKRLSAQVVHIFCIAVASDVQMQESVVDQVPRLTLPTGCPAPPRQARPEGRPSHPAAGLSRCALPQILCSTDSSARLVSAGGSIRFLDARRDI